MAQNRPTQMDAVDVADFLATQQVGILSMADNSDGYGIPISFVFDQQEHDVYFRMAYGPTSQKRSFVEASDTVSFVVIEETAEGWKSVIAHGHLETLSTSTLDSAIIESVRNLEIPYFHVHGHSSSDLSFHIVRLNVTELSGIVEG